MRLWRRLISASLAIDFTRNLSFAVILLFACFCHACNFTAASPLNRLLAVAAIIHNNIVVFIIAPIFFFLLLP